MKSNVMQSDLTAVKVKQLVLTYSHTLHTTCKIFLCFADLNPCLDVYCPSFGVCKTFSAHEARCVCYEDCPSYHDPVCTANGTTYDNKCWHELYYCRGLENNLVYHPGSCEGKNEASVKFNNRKVCSNLVSQETGVLLNVAPVSIV